MNYNDPDSSNLPSSDAVKERAAQAWENTREKAGEALRQSEHYVRQNPSMSVAAGFGLGLVLGLFIGWSIAHENEPDDYATSARKFMKRWAHKLNS